MIEILQDGAALLEASSEHKEVYTRGVESCAVHAYLGDKASLFVHDTGQLSTNSIKNLIIKCGRLQRCFSVLNSCCLAEGGQYQRAHGAQMHQWMLKLHQDRRSELRQKAKMALKWNQVWIAASDMAISTAGQVRAIPSNSNHPLIPERERRLAILTLNNLFAEQNGQNLKVDLQFKGGQFTPAPSLARSYDEMLRIANQKQAQGDHDFHAGLREYRVAFDDSVVLTTKTQQFSF